MSILVVGSVAYDDLETPAGARKDALGGAATHFSAAASFFSAVHLIGIVGDDFDPAHIEFFKSKGISTAGLKVVPGGKTFRWKGHYLTNLNQAETLSTELGVFATFDPELTDHHRKRPYLFLANIHPELQLKVLSQMEDPKLIAIDTMNYWISSTRDALQKVLERADLVFVNDGEARMLTGDGNLTMAAQKIRSWGPKYVVIKRGEHGALLFTPDHIFAAPAFLLSKVVDPTGAGDTFAGGFLGYLAREDRLNDETFRRAVILGSVMASFQVEDFGLDRLKGLSQSDIEERFTAFRDLAHFDHAPIFL